MKLKISSIADRGVPLKERLVLKVLVGTNLGEYAVFRTLANSGEVTTGVDDTYWFADKPVNAGDQVILYTKAGTPSEKLLQSGHIAHFFYWGHRGTAFWKSSEFGAVLLHVDEWISHIPDTA